MNCRNAVSAALIYQQSGAWSVAAALSGALGVVLNRPSGVRVGEVLEGWGDVVVEPDVLFQGGPVSTQGALAVATLRTEDDVPVGFRAVAGYSDFVTLRLKVAFQAKSDPRFVFDDQDLSHSFRSL